MNAWVKVNRNTYYIFNTESTVNRGRQKHQQLTPGIKYLYISQVRKSL